MIYGTKLYELKDRPGFTNKYIASIINISDSLYSRYEKEKQIIPIKHLNALSNFYNVSLDYLFEFTNIKNYPNCRLAIDKKLTKVRLKELRKKYKLTQKDLGKILNCSKSTIGGYEKGKFIIATPYLYQICKKYSISADYLLGKTDTPKYFK